MPPALSPPDTLQLVTKTKLVPTVDLASARARIQAHGELNAFISLSHEEGCGPVVAVKDLIDVGGMVTTGGSRLPRVEPARKDALLVRNLRSGDCVVVGKTNLDEWGLGVTSSNPHYGDVRNPHDPSRSPGGSSGGSAVAVAAGMADWAVGSDSGGSIRIPASLCGVVGFKPSLGAISTQGVIPLSPTLDTIGSLAPDVSTAFHAIELMAGTGEALAPAESHLAADPKLAIPMGWILGLDDATKEAWNMVSAGLPTVPFPERRRMEAAALTILLVEAAACHKERLAHYEDAYGRAAIERLRVGQQLTSQEYLQAMLDREQMLNAVQKAMDEVDALLLPATACVAPPIRQGQNELREPLTRFARPFNLTGNPVITVPAPTPGLPVGIQVVGRLGEDRKLADIAAQLERLWSPDADGGVAVR